MSTSIQFVSCSCFSISPHNSYQHALLPATLYDGLIEVEFQILSLVIAALPGPTAFQEGSRKETPLSRGRIEWGPVTTLQLHGEELPDNKKPDFPERPFDFSQWLTTVVWETCFAWSPCPVHKNRNRTELCIIQKGTMCQAYCLLEEVKMLLQWVAKD